MQLKYLTSIFYLDEHPDCRTLYDLAEAIGTIQILCISKVAAVQKSANCLRDWRMAVCEYLQLQNNRVQMDKKTKDNKAKTTETVLSIPKKSPTHGLGQGTIHFFMGRGVVVFLIISEKFCMTPPLQFSLECPLKPVHIPA